MSFILFISNSIFPLISYSYASKILLPSGIGKISFVDSLFAYFIFLAGLGIHAYGRREVAKTRNRKYQLSKLTHELFVITIIATLISYLLLFLSILCIPKVRAYTVLIAIMAPEIILNRAGVEWFYQGLEEYTYITVRSIIFKVISLILLFVLVKSVEDLYYYAFVHVFTTNASNICNLINVRKFIYLSPLKNYNFSKHLKPIFILFAASLAVAIYGHCDVTMLGFISSDYDVGIYDAALKIKSIIVAASTALMVALIPRVSYFFYNNKEKEALEILTDSLRISFLFSIPLCVFTFIFCKQIIIAVSGAKFIAASNTLRVLTLCSIALNITYLCGVQILVPIGQEKKYSQSVIIGLFIDIILNFMLIPAYGALGAAISTLITEIWNVIWMGASCFKYIRHIISNLQIFLYTIPLLLSTVVTLIVYSITQKMDLYFMLIVLGSVYFGTYFIQLFALKEHLIWSIIQRNVQAKSGKIQ